MSIETLAMPRSSDRLSPGCSTLPLSTTNLVTAGFVALAVAMGVGRFAFTPVLPMMRHEGALSITGAAWLASANYAGYLAGALLALLTSIPAHRGIRWGLVIICLGTSAMGFVQTLSGWMMLRAVTGIGSAWVLIFVSAWCLDHLKHVGRLVLNGAVFAGVGAGILVTGLLCLAFMKAKMTSTQAWVGLGSLAIIATALIWPVTRAIPKSEGKLPSLRIWNLETSRLILCYGAFGFSYIIPATFLPAMAQRIVSDPGVFGWMWPAFGAAAIVSTLVAGGLSKRIGNRQLWIACQLLMAVGVALPALWHHLCSILIAALLVGSTFMVISMVAVQEARQVAGRNPTPLISAMTTFFAIGQIIGPLLASKLSHLGDEFAGSLLLASFLLLLSACTLIRGGPAPVAKSPQNRFTPSSTVLVSKYRGDFLLNSPLISNNIGSTKKTFDDVHIVMIIHPIQAIESANGKPGTVSLPSNPHGRGCSTFVRANKQDPLTKSHQRIFPLAMAALLAAAFGSNPRARAQDVPPPISGALGQVQSVGTNSTQEANSMEAIGLLVTLEARPGKEADAEAFLKSAQPLALNEKGTLKWYAIKLGPGKFGIFDTFANEGGRNAHLTGEIAKALGARANELLAAPPQIEKTEVLASTPLKQVEPVGDRSITIQNKSGLFHINISQPLTTYKVVPSDLNHITDNDYIGVASTQAPDGTEVAKQIFVFPSEFRGAVEGSVLVDPQPGSAAQSRMTNGSVSLRRVAESHSRMTNGVVKKGRGTKLVVRYQDGQQTISVPDNVPVVGVVPGEIQLAAGEMAYAKTDKQADGTLTTHMILVIGGPSSGNGK